MSDKEMCFFFLESLRPLATGCPIGDAEGLIDGRAGQWRAANGAIGLDETNRGSLREEALNGDLAQLKTDDLIDSRVSE